MTTRWMEIAWAEIGTAEIAGARANASIIDYFKGVGRGDVTSDEVAWCAAFAGTCLRRAGVEVKVAKGQELLASSYLKIGTPIEQPRVGAIACVPRKGGSGWHVAFVAGWTETRLKLLGGNQADSVNETWFQREGAVLRWPAEPVAAVEGSRITAAAKRQVKDGGKTGGVGGAEVLIPAPPKGLTEVAGEAAQMQASWETLEKFGLFVWSKSGWVAGALMAYWLLRMLWDAGWIKRWRAQDSNEGKTA